MGEAILPPGVPAAFEDLDMACPGNSDHTALTYTVKHGKYQLSYTIAEVKTGILSQR